MRLSTILKESGLGTVLYDELYRAETAIYGDPDLTLVNWDADTVANLLAATGFAVQLLTTRSNEFPVRLTKAWIQSWFSPESSGFGGRLAGIIESEQGKALEDFAQKRLLGTEVRWRRTHLLAAATFSGG